MQECFRLLRLDNEVQNQMCVLKPMLDEDGIVRFIEYETSNTKNEEKKKEEEEMEEDERTNDEQWNYNSFEIDTVIRNYLADNTRETIRVLALFGKQKEIQERLYEMGCGMVLPQTSELGIYAVPWNELLIVFSWMDETCFELRDREVATHVLRFLSCTSDEIVCCMSKADLVEIQTLMQHGPSDEKASRWEENSVKLSVEKHIDEEDSVTFEFKTCMESLNPSNGGPGRIIKGSHAAIVRQREVDRRVDTRSYSRTVTSVDEMIKVFILPNCQEYSIKFHKAVEENKSVRDGILRSMNLYPFAELALIEADCQNQMEAISRESNQNATRKIDGLKNRGRDYAHTLFRPHGELRTLNKTLLDFKTFLQDVRSSGLALSIHELKGLQIPVRLHEENGLATLKYLYINGFFEEYQANIRSLQEGEPTRHKLSFGKKIFWSLWKSYSKTENEWHYRISRDLKRIKEKYTMCLRTAFDSNAVAKPLNSNNSMIKSVTADRKMRIQSVMKQWWGHACTTLDRGNGSLSLYVMNVQESKTENKLQCRIRKEFYADPQCVFEFDVFGASRFEIHLPQVEGAVDFFMFGPGKVLVISTMEDLTTLSIATARPWGKQEENIHFLKSYPKRALHWDLNFKERTIVFTFGDNLHPSLLSVGVYRFSETFSSLECMKTISLGVKCTLVNPIASILLTSVSNSQGLLLIDDHGISQHLSLRSYQASKCGVLTDNISGASFIQLHGGEVVSSVHQAPGVATLSVTSQAITDQRFLPETVIDFPDKSVDTLQVVNIGDEIFVWNASSSLLCVLESHVTIQTDSYRIQGTQTKKTNTLPSKNHWLWVFFDVYERFPIRGYLDGQNSHEDASVRLSIVGPADEDNNHSLQKYSSSLDRFMGIVMQELSILRKPLYELDLSSNLRVYAGGSALVADFDSLRLTSKPLDEFLRELICFVPIQICRAENNQLQVSLDESDECVDAVQLAQSIRFGLLTPMLQAWNQRVIVISSMGKQSTGKSYFLNHLTGASFAISGARCTDGAWMTLRVLGNVLLVILDFEGLGSFERTEQEDIFLSVLNSAISNLTVFRIEMRYDKSIDELFQKFQKGMQLIKGDKRLYTGSLYFSVKDVNESYQSQVLDEFKSKLGKLLRANKEKNFVSEMYGGDVTIICSAPLGTSGYYESLQSAVREIRRLCYHETIGFESGSAFLNCVRLVMAKIHMLDWTSMDESAMQFALQNTTRRLGGALRHGAIMPTGYTKTEDVPFHMLEPLTDGNGNTIAITAAQMCKKYPDCAERWMELQKELSPLDDERIDLKINFQEVDAVTLRQSITWWFQEYCSSIGVDSEKTKSRNQHASTFDVFLKFIVLRRKERVLIWMTGQLTRLPEETRRLENKLREFQVLYARCQRKCSTCQLECFLPYNHDEEQHSCTTSHACSSYCSYCEEASKSSMSDVPLCSKPAGHDEPCECNKGLEHTCGVACYLKSSPNCGQTCSKKYGHDGGHVCSVLHHQCGTPCSAVCTGTCILSMEHEHSVHKCAEIRCPYQCEMVGCSFTCGCEDHFHGADTAISQQYRHENNIMQTTSWEGPEGVHMCTNSHHCVYDCECDGICDVTLQLKKSEMTFTGARDTFDYTHQEMNGSRKKCVVSLPPFIQCHSEKHSCITDPDAIHYCDERCPCCYYFCDKEYAHSGLHNTSHGNMKKTHFVSDDVNIDIDDRKYKVGEAGVAEMCPLFCSKLGRGHVHFVSCEQNSASRCVYHGGETDRRRHCMLDLKPRPVMEMDEVLHDQSTLFSGIVRYR